MIIEQYGIRLKRLELEDIELVRYWRNQDTIRKNMIYQEPITKEMQLKWFHSIDNKYNYYFLIQFQGKPLGLINSKNISLKNRAGEGGIFIWEDIDDMPYLSIFASLCLLNTVFFEIGLFNKSYAQVLKTNYKAIQYNESLGYILLPNQDHLNNQYYILTKEDYIIKSKKINKIAQKLSNDFEPPRIYGMPSEKNIDEINKILIDFQ